ncbi:LPXTG cell wall anchor domain-containing protein [Listeria welshimeri]|nr:LPXTG cell wall anchor domain-containing protein [Listeria welshimeri]
MTSTRQAITFWYSKQIPAADVTVKFVDEIGNELATTDVLAGNINDPYETSSKEIHGWELKAIPSNANGVYTDNSQTVTYIYFKRTSDEKFVPLTPSNNETNTEKHKKAFSLSRGSKIEKMSNTDNLMEVRLPATGEAQTTENLFIITGILLLSGVIFLLGYQRKSERKK